MLKFVNGSAIKLMVPKPMVRVLRSFVLRERHIFPDLIPSCLLLLSVALKQFVDVLRQFSTSKPIPVIVRREIVMRIL